MLSKLRKEKPIIGVLVVEVKVSHSATVPTKLHQLTPFPLRLIKRGPFICADVNTLKIRHFAMAHTQTCEKYKKRINY